MEAASADRSAAAGELAEAIGYPFRDRDLLAEALTHPSALGQRRGGIGRQRSRHPRSYERLEFLGDRVLGLVAAELLWHRFAAEPEGDLTRRLTQLVRREALSRVAAAIELDRYLILSSGEAGSGTGRNPSVLADACEALIAALYLDGGFDAARSFIHRFWAPLLAEMERPPRDPKAALQEWTQARGLGLPRYEVVATRGPEHGLRFTVAARVAGFDAATATASSKRGAEAAAAAELLVRLAGDKKPAT